MLSVLPDSLDVALSVIEELSRSSLAEYLSLEV
jgi:hypothetical protein